MQRSYDSFEFVDQRVYPRVGRRSLECLDMHRGN